MTSGSSIIMTQTWKRTNWQSAKSYAVERNGKIITRVPSINLARSIALRERGKVVPQRWS
jgi:hypothetical protein